MSKVVDLKSRQSVSEETIPDPRISDLLTNIANKHLECNVADVILGFFNVETGSYETHVIPTSDISMMNLGCDLLKKSVMEYLDYVETGE